MANKHIHPFPVGKISQNHLANILVSTFKKIIEAICQAMLYKVWVRELNTVGPLGNVLERATPFRDQSIKRIRGNRQEIPAIDTIPGNHFGSLPTALGDILRRLFSTDKIRRSVIERGVPTGKFLSSIKPLLDAHLSKGRFLP